MKALKIVTALTVALASLSAHAGVVVGGSTLLNTQGLTQLESWMGQGQLTLTNIFTKQAGSTSIDFHAAVDGKGATFVLMSASENGSPWQTVGGYNPLSWHSEGLYNYDNDSSHWNGFLFNLTDGIKKNQTNATQTFNYAYYGPTFGGGHDLYVGFDLGYGYSAGSSYGGYTGQSIVNSSYVNNYYMQIGALEVFTIAPYAVQAVPEPGSIAMLGLGLVGLVASRRKAVKKA